ncbi:hypothetical protein LNP04_05545 [Chryseobacterium sp. C-71]|uniref:DUF7933 domain-containing protein n=1 Tax=Chryseobacterium sp. C-71 TaxID=2893882 RepID=UPI001E2DD18E|nr:hypothetical protein [Chryseobacterium sp. C-71]UFH33181.1 hypothetical protein LNP04_05545 [Chryseobacterium sp. C-71]
MKISYFLKQLSRMLIASVLVLSTIITVEAQGLSKSISPSSIIDGGTATYTFTVNNTQTGSVALSGINFTDTLPSGLRIAGTPNVVVTGLTGGTTTAAAGGTSIAASGYSIAANTAATITVNVTNVSGQTNTSCGSNPAAFTNTAANISNLSGNLANNVGNICLLVTDYPFVCPPAPYAAQQTWWLPNGTSKVRVDFQTGSPVLNNPATGFLGQGAAGGFEGNVAVTDPTNGALLFVTDGARVYKGSTGVLASGALIGANNSTSEAAAVIPDRQGILGRNFIIFGNTSFNTGGTLNSAKYDLQTNTVSNVTSLLPAGTVYAALEVIPHTNGTDYWVLLYTSNQKVNSYLYSATSGFNPTLVSSTDVPNLAGTTASFIATSTFISWDPRTPGKVLITRHNKIGLANFNPTTGALGVWDVKVTVTSGTTDESTGSGYSAALSPNGRYIYYGEYVSASNITRLKYFDTVNNTTTTLDSTVGPPTGIKIAPDGRVYRMGYSGGGINQLYYINANADTPPATTGSQVLFNTGGREISLQFPNNVYWGCFICNAGSIAPSLSGTMLNPACPATTADLNSLHNGTIPSGSTLVWFTNNTHTGTAYATPSAATAGTYYAFYYDSANVCYSPASAAVVVSLPDCTDSDNDGYINSADLDDDNDGILDASEMTCLTINAVQPTPAGATNSFTNTGSPSFAATFRVSTVQTAAYTYVANIFGYTNVTSVAAQTNTGSPILTASFNRPVYSLDLALDDVDGSETATLRFYDASNNLIQGSVVQQYVVFTGNQLSSVTYPSGQSIYVVGGAAASTTVQASLRITFPKTIGVSRIEFEQVTALNGTSNSGLVLMNGCVDVDTDGDGIWNRLDLDSDNDGCVDAIEGDENVTPSQLLTAASGLSVGTGSTASNQNLCATNTCIDAQGVPSIVNALGAADIGSDQGQGVGTSQFALLTQCASSVNCNKPGTTGTALPTKVGIITKARPAAGWPQNVPGGTVV